MYGWRSKIGLLIPSTNTVMEGDFWRLAPQGVSVHTARMHHDLSLPAAERLGQMAEHARQAMLDLATAHVAAIVYGCTSGSFFRGPTWEAKHAAELAAWAGRPVVTTARSCVAAMQALGLRRICIATPYGDDVNAELPPYLADFGIEVVAMQGASVRPASMTPEQIFSLVREVWREEADGLFFSCTGVPIIHLIEVLEADLGKPVVTSNQASFWAALHHVGIRQPASGYGGLLETVFAPSEHALYTTAWARGGAPHGLVEWQTRSPRET